MKISIVIPVYQGGKTITRLTDELVSNLRSYELEIILINDGSTDNSHELCLALFKKYETIVKYLWLSRNFGEHNAVLAGLSHITGDYAVIIDDDFQNPPEEIQKLVEKAVRDRLDAVYSYYSKKHHSLLRNLGSYFNNLMASYLLDKPKNLYLSSFKCMTSFTVKEVIKYKGPFPYIDGLIWRSTKNIGRILVKHEKRKEGKSGYTFKKLIKVWLNMLVNFSVLPLRISTILGVSFSMVGVVSSIILIIDKLIHPDIPFGVTSILVAILIFSGVQLLMLGLIGEYLGKLFLTNNLTPPYIIRHIFSHNENNNV